MEVASMLGRQGCLEMLAEEFLGSRLLRGRWAGGSEELISAVLRCAKVVINQRIACDGWHWMDSGGGSRLRHSNRRLNWAAIGYYKHDPKVWGGGGLIFMLQYTWQDEGWIANKPRVISLSHKDFFENSAGSPSEDILKSRKLLEVSPVNFSCEYLSDSRYFQTVRPIISWCVTHSLNRMIVIVGVVGGRLLGISLKLTSIHHHFDFNGAKMSSMMKGTPLSKLNDWEKAGELSSRCTRMQYWDDFCRDPCCGLHLQRPCRTGNRGNTARWCGGDVMVETQGEETESSDYDVAGEMQLSFNYN
jgi:hypothetical protein